MHDIRWIREHPHEFDRGLKRRGLEPMGGELLLRDQARRSAIGKFEEAQARRNAASREIGEAKKQKDEGRGQKLLAEVAALKEDLPALEAEARTASESLDKTLAEIPNLPLDD